MPAKPVKKSEMKCNVARKTPGHPKKTHVVKACEGGKEKVIRFGQKGAEPKPPREGESEADKKKRASFYARHAKNIAKGKMSAAWWSAKERW